MQEIVKIYVPKARAELGVTHVMVLKQTSFLAVVYELPLRLCAF